MAYVDMTSFASYKGLIKASDLNQLAENDASVGTIVGTNDGSIDFQGGLIIQYGKEPLAPRTAGNNIWYTVSFPKSFTTTYTITASLYLTLNGTSFNAGFDNTQLVLRNQTNGDFQWSLGGSVTFGTVDIGLNWMAIGV